MTVGMKPACTAQGCVIWLTGLPSSGKTTIASHLAVGIREQNLPVEVLDGDQLRSSLTADLGFSAHDRRQQVRRVVYISNLLIRNGINVIVALISPYQEDRDFAQRELRHFVQVYVKCPLDECIRRDPKGHYAKAIAGEITHFTGISDPYEEPEHHDVTVQTDTLSVEACVKRILAAAKQRGYFLVS